MKNLCNFAAVELIRRLKYHLVAFVVVAIWGSTFVFTKMLLQSGLSPAQIFTLRFIIAYVLLSGWTAYRAWSRGDHVSHLSSFISRLFCNSWRDELLMVGLGLTGGSLYFLTEPASDTTPHVLLSPSRAAPLCTVPCASRSTTAYACQTARKGSPRSPVDTPRGAHLLLDTIFF